MVGFKVAAVVKAIVSHRRPYSIRCIQIDVRAKYADVPKSPTIPSYNTYPSLFQIVSSPVPSVFKSPAQAAEPASPDPPPAETHH
jgi:hypothetical protein